MSQVSAPLGHTAVPAGALLEDAVRIACSLDMDRVPETVLEHAARIVADTVGVSIAGSLAPEATRMVSLDMHEGRVWGRCAVSSGETGGSTVLTAGLPRARPEDAAFLNATFGSFLELDEGMRPTGHPAMHIVPGALAVAERVGSSGTELLRAVLCGYEVASRLFRAYRLRYPTHPHGHLGALGGAIAVALLEDDDPYECALLAGTTPTATVWETCYEGATSRATYMGLAAERAVRSGRLVRSGFTGSARAFDTVFGSILSDLVDADAMTVPLEYGSLGITANYFKRHSACALTHATVDALTSLDVTNAFEFSDVLVETVENNVKLDRLAAPNDLSARFSLPYVVATVMLRGECSPASMHYSDEVAEYSKRVRVVASADLQAYWPAASPSRVTLAGPSGTRTVMIENPRGYHTDPLMPEELRTKFCKIAGGVGDPSALWDRLVGLRGLDSCRELFSTQSTR